LGINVVSVLESSSLERNSVHAAPAPPKGAGRVTKGGGVSTDES